MKDIQNFISKFYLADENTDSFDEIFLKNYKSRGDERNQTFLWYASDNEKRYYNRENVYLNNHSRQIYDKNPIIYNLNNYGFRTDDDFATDERGIITLGCSYTFGVGNYYDSTWGKKLANELNLKHFNLGVPGHSVDDCFYTMLSYSDILNFDTVFFLVPPPFRYKYFIRDNKHVKHFYEQISNPFIDVPDKTVHNSYDETFLDIFERLYYGSIIEEYRMAFKSIFSIIAFCKSNNKKIYINFCGNTPPPEKNELMGRDGHYSLSQNEFIFQEFLKQQKEDKVFPINT